MNIWENLKNEDIKGEVWMPTTVGIQGAYLVSNKGRIKSIARQFIDQRGVINSVEEKVMSQHISRKGYCKITIRIGDTSRKTMPVHRIVAMAFIKNNSIEKCFINHKNGDKKDNQVPNLEWVTSKENTVHALKSGLIAGRKGEKHSQSKLTDKNVIEMRRLNSLGIYSQYELAKEFGVKQATVNGIVNNKRWNHVHA